MDWAPSKKFLIFAGVVIVVVAVIAVVRLTSNKRVSPLEAPALISQETLASLSTDEDGDGDGLKNWEELLRNTDPANHETDGDGTDDGTEVQTRRDPTLPGPDDALPEPRASTTTGPTTQTGVFSRSIMSQYLDLVGQGVPITEDVTAQIYENAPRIEVGPPIDPYSLDEVKSAGTTSELIVRRWGNEIQNILERNAPKTENELMIILRSFDNQDPAELEQLLKIADAYDKDAEEMMELNLIPLGGEQIHLDIVNSFLFVAKDLRGLSMLYSDPVIAKQSLESYWVTSEILVASFKNLGEYLSTNTIFTPDDSGYLLVNSL